MKDYDNKYNPRKYCGVQKTPEPIPEDTYI